MKNARNLALLALAATLSAIAMAQDPDTAEERARLANQRIQIESEQRARAEQERDEPAAQVDDPPATPVQTSAAEPKPVDDSGMTQMLEQLLRLGELRDAGYVTEDEFARIKQEIIDGAL